MGCKVNKGFTLLELMIAAAILLIALSGLLSTFVYSLLINETSNNLVIAANDAQYVLEQMKSFSYNDLENYTPPQFSNLENEIILAPVVAQVWPGLKQVTINVNWTERNKTRAFSLSTQFAD